MKLIRLASLIFLLFPLQNFAQGKKNIPAGDKYDGSKTQEARTYAESLKIVNDTLTEKIMALESKRTGVKNKLDLTVSQIKNATIYLPLGLLIFSLILILAILLFLYKLDKGFGNYAFQTIGLILVVTAALFLIVTGYDKDQITPIIGLLGTIVGFIFGSNLSNKTTGKANKSDDNPNGKG
ncbi:MAG TPA: hypothetical protein VGN20_26075 [Mucilaginibacter sp.]|jgi:hypothetical protein